MLWWSNYSVVRNTPVVTTFFLEAANVGQILRMVKEQSALGQSLIGWALVWCALVLWWNFYRVCTPNERRAYWATLVGIAMNTCVILTVIYFRYLRGT